jgi:hypothetical protein
MTQEFEGQEISEFIAAIPAMKLEAPESYQRGTYLTLNVEVRVRSVRYEEITTGKRKGDLQKVHVLAVENVSVTDTLTPQQRREIMEAAAAQLTDSTGEPVVVEDGGPIEEAVAEPIAAVTPEPLDTPTLTPDTITDQAAPEEGDSGWVYEKPEYASATADVGF